MTMPSAPFSISSPMAFGQGDVLLLRHVLGEHAEQLLRRQVADVGQFGHRAVEFARREGRDDGAGAVVEARGDRAAGAEQRDAGEVGPRGKLLLRDLVDGFLVADLGDADHAVHVKADVVAVLQLDDDVEVVLGFAARQDDALEVAAGVVLHLHVAPYAHAPALERGARMALVSLERVCWRGHRDAISVLTASATSSAGTLPRSSHIASPIENRKSRSLPGAKPWPDASATASVRAAASRPAPRPAEAGHDGRHARSRRGRHRAARSGPRLPQDRARRRPA